MAIRLGEYNSLLPGRFIRAGPFLGITAKSISNRLAYLDIRATIYIIRSTKAACAVSGRFWHKNGAATAVTEATPEIERPPERLGQTSLTTLGSIRQLLHRMQAVARLGHRLGKPPERRYPCMNKDSVPPFAAPAGYEWVFTPYFWHHGAKRRLYAKDYGKKSWCFLRRTKKSS